MKRRDFLKTSALATAAVAASPLAVQAKAGDPKVKAYRALGNTGLKVSDICLGGGGLPSPSMLLRSFDRGINYVDTAPDYGDSEAMIGEALKKIPRDKLIITSKFCDPGAYGQHLRLGSKKEKYIQVVDGSLSRLNTDYLDFCLVHAIGELDKDLEKEKARLLDQEMLAAVDELKKAGKIRFLGVSSHGPNHMEDLLLTAIRSGHFSLITAAFNFMKFPRLTNVLKEAKSAGVGVIAMKTLAGAKDMNLDTGGQPFEPAALKWVLSHPEVSGLIITMKKVSQLDLYLSASGEKFTSADQKSLDLYARRFGKEYCRTGCNQCESACAKGVSIATTLRHQMYFKDYGMEKTAMESYSRLANKPMTCAACEDVTCTSACPYGLPVHALLVEAHNTLTFRV